VSRSASKDYALVAFDPGERTGFCLVHVNRAFDPRDPTPETFWITDQGVLALRELAARLPQLVRAANLVAYETWRLYKTHALALIGNDMQPSQAVGMIRYEAWRQATPLSSNGANVKVPACQTMPGWLQQHMAGSSEQHDQDAIMHAWFVASQKYYRKLRLEED
jgi:hypothetical protein